jgi:murein DD-endopeptidase MepM/ murein hydrolase activator NlpD
MLIVRHETNLSEPFFTLYGHLSLDTIEHASAGRRVKAGEQIAAVGEPPFNGNWPPHLHMQVISDLLDLGADFPGVAASSRQDYWFVISPSPAVFFPECAASLLEYR